MFYRQPITEKEKEVVKQFVRVAFDNLLFFKNSSCISVENVKSYDAANVQDFNKFNIHKLTISVNIPCLAKFGFVKENMEDIIACMVSAYRECKQEQENKEELK